MGELLGLFEGKALHRALTEAGHEVSVRTVQRWVSGQTPPKAQDMAAIRRLLELTDEEAAPPAWAERLMDEAVTRVIEALAPADLREAAELLIARLEALPPPPVGSSPGSDASAAPGAVERPEPGP